MDFGNYDMCVHYGNRFDWRNREEEIIERPRRRFHPMYYRFHRHLPFRRRIPMRWW